MSTDSDSVSPLKFVEEASRPYHLTIADVLSFPIGESRKIFFMDRNVFDMSCDVAYNKIGVPTKPSEFFRKGYYVLFTRTSGLKATWNWQHESDSGECEYELDVDMGKAWYPMTNGRLPISDSQGLFEIPDDFAGKLYSDLPSSTRVGWRGPMMLAENMNKCPNIVLRENGRID